MERVAILGGTFNPIHNGHLKLAENALRQFALDSCWFMPAPNPPHKEGAVATDFSDRLAMVRLAIASCRSFRASDFEAGLEGKSYTSRTLSLLRENFPRTDFYFVVGADSFYEIERWHEPGEVLRLAALIVADRDYDKNHASLEAHAAQSTLPEFISFTRKRSIFLLRASAGSLPPESAERSGCCPRQSTAIFRPIISTDSSQFLNKRGRK